MLRPFLRFQAGKSKPSKVAKYKWKAIYASLVLAVSTTALQAVGVGSNPTWCSNDYNDVFDKGVLRY